LAVSSGLFVAAALDAAGAVLDGTDDGQGEGDRDDDRGGCAHDVTQAP
jgi:hypothetical protein